MQGKQGQLEACLGIKLLSGLGYHLGFAQLASPIRKLRHTQIQYFLPFFEQNSFQSGCQSHSCTGVLFRKLKEKDLDGMSLVAARDGLYGRG